MNTHVDKTPENKSQSVANEVSQKQSSSVSTFHFVDNRPEAIAQRKLQEIVNSKSRSQKMTQTKVVGKDTVQLMRGARPPGMVHKGDLWVHLLGQDRHGTSTSQDSATPVDPYEEYLNGDTPVKDEYHDDEFEFEEQNKGNFPNGVKFIREHTDYDINHVFFENDDLTPEICHSLTFGRGINELHSVQETLDLWNQIGRPNILVCIKNDQVAHTALRVGDHYRQTLPGGPIFKTKKAYLKSKYPECFELPYEREALVTKGRLIDPDIHAQEECDKLLSVLGEAIEKSQNLEFLGERHTELLNQKPSVALPTLKLIFGQHKQEILPFIPDSLKPFMENL